MSAPQFTPAPWKALPCIKREGHTIYDTAGIVIANTGTHSAGGDEPANARLIAAAPELYEALENTLALLGRYRRATPLGHQPHMTAGKADVALIRGAAALAKALGQ